MTRAELYTDDGTYENMSTRQLRKLGDAKDPAALNMLGVRYGTGTRVKKDSRRSFDYYRRGAELGMPRAQANLAFMYFNGEGTRKNAALALSWARKSKDAGDSQAQDLMGYMLGKGIGTKLDLKEAAFCYLLAARQGKVSSQQTLANLYSQGYGIPVDEPRALVWRARAREAATTGKPWFDDTPLLEMPAEWTPPYEFLEEVAADSIVSTPHYTFRVSPPTARLAQTSWKRYSGVDEQRNTSLWIGMQGYDSYGVLVEARGKLAAGESLEIVAQRVRPMLKFRSSPVRPECVSIDPSAPFVRNEFIAVTAFCQNPKDQEIFEIAVSRISLSMGAKANSEPKEIEELAAEMNAVLISFRFE